MNSISFETIYKEFKSESEVIDFLRKNLNGFIFEIIIERARHYSDLAHYYLEAAYIGQELIEHSERIDFKLDWSVGYHPVAKLSLRPENEIELAKLIYFFGRVYPGEEEEKSEDFMEGLLEYKENLESYSHAFPELVDDYYANYINGEYYEYSPTNHAEFFESEFLKFPERKYRFWKSAFSNTIGEDFYVSTDSWIIPKHSDLSKILKESYGTEKINFLKADFFALGNISYLISEGLIIHFPFDALLMAKHCTREFIDDFRDKNDIYKDEGDWMHQFLTFDRGIAQLETSKENYRGYPEDRSEELIDSLDNNELLRTPPVICFYLSEYGDHILVKDSNFSYLFFGTDKLAHNELISLGNRLSVLFQTTTNLAGINVEINCPWEKLDDEKFEELCYDIIYHNPKFDNTTIRKMGKSRSRDGGRDIIAYTHARPGYRPEKFIFQCKYMNPGKSLSASQVLNISDTIDQYNAQGYGIMTSVVIDATLYDRIDAIAENKKIKTQEYSVYEMERILARFENIKQRHFSI